MENLTSKNNLDKHELQLPSSWVKCSLEAVCEILDSRRIPINANERADRTSGKSRKELFPYFGATGQVGYIDDYIFEGEYVLLGEDGAPFLDSFKDKAYIVSGKFWVNNHAHILRSKVSNKFLCHYLNQFDYAKYVTGTTRLKLNQSSLLNIPVVFPPENEQHRIVAKIEELFSELDKGVESLKVAREQLKVYRQALLKHAFEGKLTEKWRKAHADQLETADQLLDRIKHERENQYQQQLAAWKKGEISAKPSKAAELDPIQVEELQALPEIPKDWKYVRLAEIAAIGSGMSVSKDRKLNDPIEVAYLRVANVQRGKLVLNEIRTMKIEKDKLEELELQHWDVLFNEGGDRDKLGRGWVWESQIKPCITQNHVFRVTTILGLEFHAKLISHWGNTFGQAYFDDEGKQTTNLASINKGVLSKFPVPLSPIEEQQKILEEIERQLSILNQFESEIDAALSNSETLRQSILKKAFSGQLVPQDLNDEPASILLERIRAERETVAEPMRDRVKNKKKERISSMADLIEVLKSANTWLSARDVFRQCGIGDGAETDTIEKLYFELRDHISEERLEVERRGDEDWLRIRPTKEK